MKVKLELEDNDIGQVLDGLAVRAYIWRDTERYLNGEFVDGDIEECSDAEEAGRIAHTYERIIAEIQDQRASQTRCWRDAVKNL